MKPEIKQLTRVDDIYKAVLSFNTDIVPSFSDRGLDLKDYAQKLFEFAIVYTLWHDNQACGFVTFYANDTIHETAYLAQIAVKSQVINRGFGYALLTLAMETSKEKGMKTMKLEVYNKNHMAIAFYKRQGFIFCGESSETFSHMCKAL